MCFVWRSNRSIQKARPRDCNLAHDLSKPRTENSFNDLLCLYDIILTNFTVKELVSCFFKSEQQNIKQISNSVYMMQLTHPKHIPLLVNIPLSILNHFSDPFQLTVAKENYAHGLRTKHIRIFKLFHISVFLAE